ncbi:MAG: hypothetical protein NTY12_01705 [Candidatus Falkowbacteria bacterium]|nr:hypothetical protein [Candidatus Falkowbacteria bacterium]
MKNLILTLAVVAVLFTSFTSTFAQPIASNYEIEPIGKSVAVVEKYTICNEMFKDQSVEVKILVVDGQTVYSLEISTSNPKYSKVIKSVEFSFYKNDKKITKTFNSNTFSQKDLNNFREYNGMKNSLKLSINVTTDNNWKVFGFEFGRPFDELK